MTSTDPGLPAWSAAFASDRRDGLRRDRPFGRLERSWAFGDGLGSGITVAIVDSGVEGSHPAVDGALRRSVRVQLEGDEATIHDDEAIDVVGHGTACASIIHALAPNASLLSVRVLGPDNRGKGLAFAAGLEWAIEQGASVISLSLSSRSEALFGVFHDLADRAYFAGAVLVCAANNVAIASSGHLGGRPRRPRSRCLVLQSGASGRVRGVRARRRRRLEGRQPDRRDRQQLCRTAHRRLRGPDPSGPPERQSAGSEGDPRRDGRPT